MLPVDPRPKLPPLDGISNARYVVIAAHQEGVRPLPAVIVDDGHGIEVVTRWHLSDDERRAITDGEDIWLKVSTGGKPLQPLLLGVHPWDLVE